MSKALLTEWLLDYFYQRLPFPKEWLPQGSYWVGGSLRDAYLAWLRGQPSDPKGPLDLDLMCPADPVGWAAGVARRLKAGFVVLDAERQIARIVLGQGRASPPTAATVDVALQVGPTPEADLRQRDFTCNALALALQEGQLLDPTGGRADIEQGCLRMVHPDNLSADPVRLLRAYRQAAQLGFVLDPATAEAIGQRASLLARVAAERVRTEVVALLETRIPGLAHLQAAAAAGLLVAWLPRLTPQSCGFAQAQAVWQWAEIWQLQYPRTLAELAQPLADRRSALLATVVAALLWDPAGTPAETVEAELERLRFSRAEMRAIQKLHQLLPQFQPLLTHSPPPSQQWRLYHQAGSLFGGLALLAAATGSSPQKIEPWLQRYEDPQDPLAHLVPLLDGRDLLHTLGGRPGPWVGQLLQDLQEAQASGQIQTRAEALSFARRWRERSSQP
ncbi:CCA tRNA nucleotidyltransferase [Synechococcus sp. H70.1]|uniref:CCA tRNA nucleotidyltransferase n=1 Tax=Synechococcus sp. H70.1 TaxID=2964527 RepID=UPI0039C746E9